MVLSDLNAERGSETTAALRSGGFDVHFILCDVSNGCQVAAMLAEAEERFAAPDILVNNAGIYRTGEFLTLTEADFDEMIRINLKSVFITTQAVARRLVAQRKSGAVVNISSINYQMTSGQATAYTASKGGVSALTAATALALADEGIRVNAIAPGTIATDMTAKMRDDPVVLANALARTPLRRLGQPEEIAAVACFLASDDANYMTGQTLFVDGGRTALGIVMPPRASS